MLAAALDANRELARLAAELRGENERLRAENAEQAAELGKTARWSPGNFVDISIMLALGVQLSN